MLGRPVRERPVEQVLEIVRACLANTGDKAVSLLSLSAADYSQLKPLLRRLREELTPRRVSVSLPSLRISSFDVELAAEVSAVRKSGFTFAPEAGSERLRRVINKPLDEAEFLRIIGEVFRAGWRTIKMYFMIGLPGETDADLDGIVAIVRGALDCARRLGARGAQINVSLSPFVPKAHTPFQWEGQPPRDEMKRRIDYVRRRLPERGVAVKTSPIDASVLEAVLARGDRRLGRAIERAWRAGCRFDAWSDWFRPALWWAALQAEGLSAAWYAERLRADDEVLPYDHLLSPPGKSYLALQRDYAHAGTTTPDCANNPCSRCDACARPKQHRLAPEPADGGAGKDAARAEANAGESAPPRSAAAPPVMRVRLRFTKTGSLRFIGHLDLMETIHRLLRRSGAPLAHSQGFNPQLQVALSPPLPLGFEGLGELADVFLVERVDLRQWMGALSQLVTAGLAWTAAEEVPLAAPSIQQALTRYDYRVSWRRQGDEAPLLPLDRDTLDRKVAEFLESDSKPIQILRKGKLQDRDARAFVLDCRTAPSVEGRDLALEMTVRSENGATLNPLTVLESIFGAPVDAGVLLRATRLPLEL
jgi:radical SAM-linked protein